MSARALALPSLGRVQPLAELGVGLPRPARDACGVWPCRRPLRLGDLLAEAARDTAPA